MHFKYTRIILFLTIILFLSLIKYIEFFIFKKKQNIKVCICTCAKNENKYIREFVEYYLNYGIDTIFIYDNNDINGERFETPLEYYIRTGFVKIMDWRGKTQIQMEALNDCYKKFKKMYSWFIFYDIDEFIHLNDYKNIKDYLRQEHFDNCNAIYLNHILHTDNDQIYYKNDSVIKRFPKIQKFDNSNKFFQNTKFYTDVIKPIFRGNISNVTLTSPHYLYLGLKNICNGFGNTINKTEIHLEFPDHKYYYFDHYYFKSSEEYLQKISKGSVFFGKNHRKIDMFRISLYFAFNEITIKKIDYFESKTNLSLKAFKKYIKSSSDELK